MDASRTRSFKNHHENLSLEDEDTFDLIAVRTFKIKMIKINYLPL